MTLTWILVPALLFYVIGFATIAFKFQRSENAHLSIKWMPPRRWAWTSGLLPIALALIVPLLQMLWYQAYLEKMMADPPEFIAWKVAQYPIWVMSVEVLVLAPVALYLHLDFEWMGPQPSVPQTSEQPEGQAINQSARQSINQRESQASHQTERQTVAQSERNDTKAPLSTPQGSSLERESTVLHAGASKSNIPQQLNMQQRRPNAALVKRLITSRPWNQESNRQLQDSDTDRRASTLQKGTQHAAADEDQQLFSIYSAQDIPSVGDEASVNDSNAVDQHADADACEETNPSNCADGDEDPNVYDKRSGTPTPSVKTGDEQRLIESAKPRNSLNSDSAPIKPTAQEPGDERDCPSPQEDLGYDFPAAERGPYECDPALKRRLLCELEIWKVTQGHQNLYIKWRDFPDVDAAEQVSESLEEGTRKLEEEIVERFYHNGGKGRTGTIKPIQIIGTEKSFQFDRLKCWLNFNVYKNSPSPFPEAYVPILSKEKLARVRQYGRESGAPSLTTDMSFEWSEDRSSVGGSDHS